MSLTLIIPSNMSAAGRRMRLMDARAELFIVQMRKVACQAICAGEAVAFYARMERVLMQRVAAWKAVQI